MTGLDGVQDTSLACFATIAAWLQTFLLKLCFLLEVIVIKNRLLTRLATIVALLTISAPGFAQQIPDAIINVDGIGFARMIDDRLVAFDLVAAYDEHAIVEADCNAFKADAKGVNWCFSNADNQATFEAATEENGNNKYLPFVGGHCALGMSFGNLTARGDPRTAIRIGDLLVLNGRFVVRTRFLEDTERNIDNARLRYELALAAGNLKVN